jgi:cephalosporin hydroxylase
MLIWEGSRFKVGNSTFQTITNLSDLFTLKEINGYILGKTKRYIDKYIEHLTGNKFKNIFELGIFRGGSTVFFAEFLHPNKLVAIDFAERPIKRLNDFAAEPSNLDKIKPYYGVDQADIAKLDEIYCSEFGTEKLDLVIDDASHMLEETRASFNYLFPRLRPGGIYVIEDWSWSHIPSSKFHQETLNGSELSGLTGSCNSIQENFTGKSTLANLVIEIMLASVSAPGAIDELIINDGFVIVKRGVLELPGEFDVSQYGFNSGLHTGRKNFFL